MAIIGQSLTVPESGWRRYEPNDSNFLKIGSGWTYNSSYAGVAYYTKIISDIFSFKFYGSKIRLILYTDNTSSNDCTITIDENTYSFSNYSTTSITNNLMFEKTNLLLGNHKITLKTNQAAWIEVDAIDIDATGYLVHSTLNQVNNLNELQIGNCIPCRYTVSTSGQVGIFCELGITIVNEIPITSSATSDGSFYFIHSGYDTKGRMKLIADRNIQNSISWDTLNTNGIINGLNLYLNDFKDGTYFGDRFTGSTYDNQTIAQAFDRDISTHWQFTVNNAGGITYNSPEIINIFRITQNPSYIRITGFKIQAKNTIDTDWIDLYIGTASDLEKYIKFNNTTAYEQYRFLCTAGGSYNYIKEIFFSNTNSNIEFTMRLLTGGISLTDTDNEWDQIIVNDNLNNIITAGDNNIWHWNGFYSWTSSTGSTNPNRIIRGNTAVSTTNAPTGVVSSTVNTTTGFRPMLLVEKLNSPSIINNLTKTIINNQVQLSADSISDPDNDTLKYQVSIKKSDNTIVIKREYDTILQSSPLSFNTLTFTANEFGLGTNQIIIDMIDSNNKTSQSILIVTKTKVFKLLIQDGKKWKYINNNNLETISDDYTVITDLEKENIFIKKGMNNSINISNIIYNEIENNNFKVILAKINILN